VIIFEGSPAGLTEKRDGNLCSEPLLLENGISSESLVKDDSVVAIIRFLIEYRCRGCSRWKGVANGIFISVNFSLLQVSWVRRRGEELHLLTIGLDTYASDSRFSLAFEKPNDWRLLLRSATERDAGLYECQVTAHPPLIRTVHLAVSGKWARHCACVHPTVRRVGSLEAIRSHDFPYRRYGTLIRRPQCSRKSMRLREIPRNYRKSRLIGR